MPPSTAAGPLFSWVRRFLAIRHLLMGVGLALNGPLILSAYHSTITDNTGGGIALSGGSTVGSHNNIIFGNTGADVGRSGTTANTLVAENSIFGTGTTIDTDNFGNFIAVDPRLDVLRDNGGLVRTHDLLPGSIALTNGDVTLSPSDFSDVDDDSKLFESLPLDANGNARVASDGTLDLGAVQFEDDFGSDSLTSGLIEVGQSLTGALDFTGDEDWISFLVPAGSISTITVQGLAGDGSPLDTLQVSVTDGFGNGPSGPLLIDTSAPNSDVVELQVLAPKLTSQTAHTNIYVSVSSTGNDIGTYDVTVTQSEPAQPELVFDATSGSVTSFVGPDAQSALVGEFIEVSSLIQNIGGATAPASTRGYYLSSDNVITTDDILIATSQLLALDGGTSVGGANILELRGGIPAGSYFTGAIADINDTVDEFYEGNNALLFDQPLFEVSGAVSLMDSTLSTPLVYARVADAVATASAGNMIAVDGAIYTESPESVFATVSDVTFDLDAGAEVVVRLAAQAGLTKMTSTGAGSAVFIANDLGNLL